MLSDKNSALIKKLEKKDFFKNFCKILKNIIFQANEKIKFNENRSLHYLIFH
jgi:hypothetical protein